MPSTSFPKDNFQRKNVIITSTLIFTEVLSVNLDEESERKFRKLFRNGDHIAYDVDPPIAMMSTKFGKHFSRKKAIEHWQRLTRYTWPRLRFTKPMRSGRLMMGEATSGILVSWS